MLLRKLLKRLETPLPGVQLQRCWRIKASDTPAGDCSICADACPHSAIKYIPGPVISHGSCTGCGICVAVCPPAALESTELRLAVLARLGRPGRVVCGCAGLDGKLETIVSPASDTNSEISADRFTTAITALCSITWQDWAAHMVCFPQQQLVLYCGACKDCKGGLGLEHVQMQAARAEAGFKSGQALQIVTKIAALPETITGINRREFFSLFRSSIDGRVTGVTARQVLWEKAVKAAGIAPGQTSIMPWADYTIHKDCDACGICVRICPWNAWQISSSGQERMLRFAMKSCRNCGACQAACPGKAIVPVTAQGGVLLPVPGWQVKHVVRVKQCTRCRAPLPNGCTGVCDNCKKQLSVL